MERRPPAATVGGLDKAGLSILPGSTPGLAAEALPESGSGIPATMVRMTADVAPPPAASRRLGSPAAEILTFIAAACVLVLEIAAGRLLAPYVGVTLQTWTGIIGVILGGIALGAWAGGRLADRLGAGDADRPGVPRRRDRRDGVRAGDRRDGAREPWTRPGHGRGARDDRLPAPGHDPLRGWADDRSLGDARRRHQRRARRPALRDRHGRRASRARSSPGSGSWVRPDAAADPRHRRPARSRRDRRHGRAVRASLGGHPRARRRARARGPRGRAAAAPRRTRASARAPTTASPSSRTASSPTAGSSSSTTSGMPSSTSTSPTRLQFGYIRWFAAAAQPIVDGARRRPRGAPPRRRRLRVPALPPRDRPGQQPPDPRARPGDRRGRPAGARPSASTRTSRSRSATPDSRSSPADRRLRPGRRRRLRRALGARGT